MTRFKVGDKVVTLFNQGHQAASLTIPSAATGLGGVLDGTLTEYSVFDQLGLVEMPCTLSFQEAATLSCAAVTAWNALFGLEGKPLKAGQVVLTQGTGGVSIFAAQVRMLSLLPPQPSWLNLTCTVRPGCGCHRDWHDEQRL